MTQSWQGNNPVPPPKKEETVISLLETVASNTTPSKPVPSSAGPTAFPNLGWPIYMPNGATLQILTHSSIVSDPGQTIEYIWMDNNGTLNTGLSEQKLSQASGRSGTGGPLNTFDLNAGWLLGVYFNGNASGIKIKRGQYFISAYLVLNGIVGAYNLLADYVTENSRPSWPGGRVISSIEGPGYSYAGQITNTTNAEASVTVPAGAKWLLKSFTVGTLASPVTSGALLIADSGGNLLAPLQAIGVGVTSQASWYIGELINPTVVSQGVLGNLPSNLYLEAGWKITTSLGAQSLSNIFYTVEEWLEP